MPVNRPDTFNSSDGQIEMGVRVLTTELPPWQHGSHHPRDCGCGVITLYFAAVVRLLDFFFPSDYFALA